jgi:hypothetical protein
MIQLSNTVQQIILLNRIKYFFLVSIDSGKNYTSAPFDITMSNNITYLSDGGLIGVDPPTYSSTVDRSTYSIIFADINQELKSLFEEGATGSAISVRCGFYNTLDETVNGVEVGNVFTNINDTVLLYKGVIDSQSYSINMDNSDITAKVEGSSPMADLDLVKSFYTNKESMNQKNSSDTSFDKVFEGSGEITLKWGKK